MSSSFTFTEVDVLRNKSLPSANDKTSLPLATVLLFTVADNLGIFLVSLLDSTLRGLESYILRITILIQFLEQILN